MTPFFAMETEWALVGVKVLCKSMRLFFCGCYFFVGSIAVGFCFCPGTGCKSVLVSVDCVDCAWSDVGDVCLFDCHCCCLGGSSC